MSANRIFNKKTLNNRNLINRLDFIIIGVMIIVSISILFAYSYSQNDGPIKCEISYDGEIVEVLDLSEQRTVTLKENPHIKFEIRNHSIGFIESDCPDKICVKTGFLKFTGQMAACLPNRVSIKVISGVKHPTDLDAIAD